MKAPKEWRDKYDMNREFYDALDKYPITSWDELVLMEDKDSLGGPTYILKDKNHPWGKFLFPNYRLNITVGGSLVGEIQATNIGIAK